MADDTILIDVVYNTDEAEKEIDSLTASIEGLKVTQGSLDAQLAKGTISQKEYSKESEKIKVKLQAENKQRKDIIRGVQSEVGSRDRLRQTISALIKKRNSLNTTTKAGRKESEKLRQEINRLDGQLQRTGTTTEKAKGNIGKYGQAFNGLPGPINGVISSLKTFAKVLFATPLGWLIGLIAGAGAALKTFFTGSVEGQERWNKTMAKAKGAMSVFKDELIKIGKGISDFTKNIKESEGGIRGWAERLKSTAQAGFKKFGEDVKDKGIWKTLKDNTSDAIDVVKGKLNELGDSLKENMARAEAIAASQNKLRFEEIDSLTDIAILNRDIAELRAEAADRENSDAETRLSLLDQAIEKQNEILTIEEQLAERRIQIQQMEMAQGQNRIEDYEKLAELEKAQIDLETVNAERRRRFQSERQTAINQMAAEQTALNQAEEAGIEAEINARLENFDLLINKEKAANKKSVDNHLETEEDKTDISKDESGSRREILTASINAISEISGQATQFLIDQNNIRLAAELAAAGDDEEKKAEIEKKYAKKSQKLAITQAIITGSLAILGALATQPFVPVGLIAAATAAVATGFQIAAIKNAKFERGGKVPIARRGASFGQFSGPSHSAGGIDLFTGSGKHVANVQGKENFYVINKDASSYINSLSDINQRIGGGVPLSNKSNHMADGGRADLDGSLQDGQQGVNINDITSQVVQNLPPIVVQTVDIKTGLQDREEVINAGVI